MDPDPDCPEGILDDRILRAALALPDFDGRAAQKLMEPASRGRPPQGVDPAHPLRDAAALAYVFEQAGRLLMPLTVRGAALREHRGQVSLPGGRPEPDEPLLGTALREAREEIALDVADAEVLGRLRPVEIPVTHTRLHVHVALGPAPARLVPQPGEVAQIEIVQVDHLLDPARRKHRTLEIQDRDVEVPYFDVAGLFLWGATAMALSELAERLRSAC